jgi:hypothetical protein
VVLEHGQPHKITTLGSLSPHQQVGEEEERQVQKPNRPPPMKHKAYLNQSRAQSRLTGREQRAPPEPESLQGQSWLGAVGPTHHNRKVPQEDQEQRERQGERHREVCFWLVLSRGFPPAGASSRVSEAHSHTLGKLLLVWCSTILTLVQERCPFMWSPEMLQAGVESSCLYGPKN